MNRKHGLWLPLLLAAGLASSLASTCASAQEGPGAAQGSDAKSLPASGESAPSSLDNPVELARHPEYLQSLKKKIGENLRYPPSALQYGLQGDVGIRIVLNRDGSVVYAVLMRVSGVSTLDKEAIEVVHRAGPFAAVPDDVAPAAKTFAFTMPITYKLNS